MDTQISLKELLEAGCHFGHQTQRWNPKASVYIYSHKDGIHIIDLVKTRDGLIKARDFLRETVGSGKKVLFLGTKRQAKEGIILEAQRCKAFYVTERWPAGLFTNYEVMKKNIDKIKKIRLDLSSEEEKAKYTKKEIGIWEKDLKKLLSLYGGIEDLTGIPAAIFVTDVRRDDGAVREANRMGVKVVAVVDTNCNPTNIDFPIPANDDAVGSLKLIMKYIADAVEEGNIIWEKKQINEEEVKSQKSNVKTTHSQSSVQVTQNSKVEEKLEKPIKNEGEKTEKPTDKIVKKVKTKKK